ncbi:MAG: glycoside hydrolase family 127 protein [Ignisphaera sp.]
MEEVFVVNVSKSPYAKLCPVPLNRVKVSDGFWRQKLELLAKVVLKHQFSMLEDTGRLENFRRASGKGVGGYVGRFWFNDSDVYKVIEASAYALVHVYDNELYNLVTQAIEDVVSAQMPNGYLNTFIQLNNLERWSNLAWSHELYCAGHLIQAGIATRRALNDQKLFDAAKRFANLISDVFGWGRLEAGDGHPEIELALIELYRETGERKYLETAKFFIDFRGRKRIANLHKVPYPLLFFSHEYLVDHENIRDMQDFVGSHAVRTLYLFAGATDLYLETGEERLIEALKRLWRKTLLKMYITGGLGSRYEGESFGEDYELPNERAYSETCAAVAGVMWAWRMFLAIGDAEYMDVLETILYNAALAGISLDGIRYFYVNPLADYHAKHERSQWYECACCPPNIARLIAYVPEMIYAISKQRQEIWINLFIGSKAEISLNGNRIGVEMKTNYPWDGNIEIRVYPEKSDEFSLRIRIPRWAEGARISVENIVYEPKIGEYAELKKVWNWGDTVKIALPVKPRLVKPHPWIESDYSKVAIARGPLVYAVEEIDNGFDVRNLAIDPENTRFEEEFKEDLLGGIVVVKGTGYLIDTSNWKNTLYTDYTRGWVAKETKFMAIPYHLWNNRGRTRMTVWIKSLRNFKNMV